MKRLTKYATYYCSTISELQVPGSKLGFKLPVRFLTFQISPSVCVTYYKIEYHERSCEAIRQITVHRSGAPRKVPKG